MKRSYIREILDNVNNNTISFAGGLPDEKLFPLKELQESSFRVFQNPKCLQYSKSNGISSLRKQIANLYTEKFDWETNENEILITTGSQQSFYIISKIFQSKQTIIQNPSYVGAICAFKSLGLKLSGFDEISDLEKLLTKNSTLYIMSDFQNPNTSSYNNLQRLELLKILKDKKSFLIEDGAYSLLDFEACIKKPISSKYENSFHLGSFSKIISPGLRVGWIRAKKELIEKLLISKEAIDLHTSTLNQMIISDFISNNDLELHLNKIRNSYEKKMIFMSNCLKKYVKEFNFIMPKGGMFIYGEFNNIDTFVLAKKALEKDLAFVPGEVFYAKAKKTAEIRFNFTNCSYKEIIKGIKILSSLIEKNNS